MGVPSNELPKIYVKSVVKIDLPNTNTNEQENSEFHAINVATDYAALKKAFEGADAIIHLAAIPSPGGQDQDPAVKYSASQC
jgi:nucleoside-diphosphate-sugar epimerase